MKKLIQFLAPFFPLAVHRCLLNKFCGYQISKSSKLGYCWIFAKQFTAAANSYVGHGTVIKGLGKLELNERSRIGRLNWITAFPKSNNATHFTHLPERRPELIIGEHSAITNRHIIDCTDRIQIGKFSTIAGFRSQFLTHTIDLPTNRQTAAPILIGDYCFVGTGTICLGGSQLPDYCVIGAGSMFRTKETQTHHLYSGNPAKAVTELSPDYQYFNRSSGFVR